MSGNSWFGNGDSYRFPFITAFASTPIVPAIPDVKDASIVTVPSSENDKQVVENVSIPFSKMYAPLQKALLNSWKVNIRKSLRKLFKKTFWEATMRTKKPTIHSAPINFFRGKINKSRICNSQIQYFLFLVLNIPPVLFWHSQHS